MSDRYLEASAAAALHLGLISPCNRRSRALKGRPHTEFPSIAKTSNTRKTDLSMAWSNTSSPSRTCKTSKNQSVRLPDSHAQKVQYKIQYKSVRVFFCTSGFLKNTSFPQCFIVLPLSQLFWITVLLPSSLATIALPRSRRALQLLSKSTAAGLPWASFT